MPFTKGDDRCLRFRAGSRVAARAAARSFESVHWAFSGWASTNGSGSAPWPAPKAGESAKVKNCILIWLAGGPSHIDTFDPKPGAAADVRGEFKPIATSVPGLQISEVFPNLAKVMDRVTLIRSMTSPEADHDRAAHHLLTGYRPSPALVYPGYGSVVSKVREATRGMLPPYVAVPDAPIFASSGYLTPAYDPFSVSRRSQPGELPGPEPDAARPVDARAAAAAPRDGQEARRLRPRRPGHAADLQPRPVRRAGLFAVDLERGPGGVSDERGVGGGPREVRPDDGRPVVPAGAAAGRSRRFVRHVQRSRGRPARLGHPRAELPDDQEHPGPAARQGGGRAASKTCPNEACSTARSS